MITYESLHTYLNMVAFASFYVGQRTQAEPMPESLFFIQGLEGMEGITDTLVSLTLDFIDAQGSGFEYNTEKFPKLEKLFTDFLDGALQLGPKPEITH